MSRVRPLRLVSSCLGCGYLRPAPGTIGSAFGLGLHVWLVAGRSSSVQVMALLAITAVGVWAATATARGLQDEDPSEVVIDELAGIWVALLATSTPLGWALAFVAFRAFDIVKPFPVNVAERLPEGWGIMADDLVAGLYALAVVALAGLWWEV